jgi:hypothetical protein
MPTTTARRVLTQAEIEWKIEDLIDELERSIESYRDISEAAVGSEMDYRMKTARARIGVADRPGIKMTVAERDARIDLACEDELRAYKITAASQASMREALRSLHTRIDSLRTLSANARAAT